MALTQERADVLSEFLAEDSDRTERLLGLAPEEALAEINGNGYDYTSEELEEYCQALKTSVPEGELNADDLDNVAGGTGSFSRVFLKDAALFSPLSRFANRSIW